MDGALPDGGLNGLRVMPETPEAWRNDGEAARWDRVQAVTGVVTGALEVQRREKVLGAALEAAVIVNIETPGLPEAFQGLDPAEVFRVSQARLAHGNGQAEDYRSEGVAGVSVTVTKAPGRKCARSWRVLPEVGSNPRYPDLSMRDAEAVAWWDAEHA